VNIIVAEKSHKVSVEHTDFNNPMHGYVTGLHMSEFPSAAIFFASRLTSAANLTRGHFKNYVQSAAELDDADRHN
jgi:hypothetical protein